MSNLVIVESPAKAKTIKKYLGSDYEVVASMGHVRDLPKARLSVDIKNGFAPKYDIIKGKETARVRRFHGTLRIFSVCPRITATAWNSMKSQRRAFRTV